MSVEIERRTDHSLDKGQMLRFKVNISLDDFAKLMTHYNAIVKICTGKDASYRQFTAWLEREGYVE